MEEEIIYFYNVKDGKYYQSRYTHRWLNNLQQQCKKQKEVIDKVKEYITIYRSYEDIDGKDYLKGRYEIGTLSLSQVDKLLDILKEVK